MIFTKDTIEDIKSANNGFKWIFICVAVAATAVFVALLALALNNDVWEDDTFLASTAIKSLLISSALLCLANLARRQALLALANLRKGQDVYVVNYDRLTVTPDVVERIDPTNIDRLVVLRYTGAVAPMHRDVYCDKQKADAALNRFIDSLYTNICLYVDVRKPVSDEFKTGIREGFKDYNKNRCISDPTIFDISEVVKSIEKYMSYKKYCADEIESAKETLKNYALTNN